MVGLSQNFNQTGAMQDLQMAVLGLDVPDYDAANDAYFDNIMRNPDLNLYDNDVISNRLGDSGNDQAAYTLFAEASTTGDHLGNNHVLERDVDEAMEAVYSQNDSLNISDAGYAHDRSVIGGDIEHFNYDTPEFEIHEDHDMEVAIMAVYEAMVNAGVPESELNLALATGGVDNHAATVDAFRDLSDKFSVGLNDHLDKLAQSYKDLTNPNSDLSLERMPNMQISQDLQNRPAVNNAFAFKIA